MRIVERYYDMEGQYWCDASGAMLPPRQQPFVGVEKVLFRLHLLDGEVSPYPIASDVSFEAALATSFTSGVVLMRALNDAFNIPSDWTGSDGLCLSLGRITVQCNFCTNPMVSEMSGIETDRFPFQIYLYDTVGNVDHINNKILVQNMFSVGGAIPVPVTYQKGIVDVTEASESVTIVADVSTAYPMPTLIAPVGDTNNVFIANVQLAVDKASFTVYFSSPIPTTGFKVSYIIMG